MQIIEKVKNICNYSDSQNITGNNLSFSWLETISSNDEEFLNWQKRKNRDLSIDVILDEISEDEWLSKKSDNNYNLPFQDSPLSSIVSPRLMTAYANAIKYNEDLEIYDYLTSFLDKNTQSSKNLQNSKNTNLDLTLSNNYNLIERENFEANIRRIITKITMHSNIIAMEGRIGPGNTAIVGQNNWKYFNYIETQYGYLQRLLHYCGANVKIIYEKNIDKNKVIICRSGNINNPGILLVNDSINKNFYFKETTFWDRQYSWFSIK